MSALPVATLPDVPVEPSRIVLGAMRLGGLDDAALRDLVQAALDAGVTVIDHADIYGGEPHAAERRFGESGALPPSVRDRVIVQSKTGIREGFYDLSAGHIVERVEGSLRALDTDRLDVLMLHRPDALADLDEVAEAFDALHAAGKVRAFGVSNHTPGQIALLQRVVAQPIVVHQVQLSVTDASLIAQGMTTNVASSEQSLDRDGGVLDWCRLHGIALQAWGPLQSSRAGGLFLDDREGHPELVDALAEIAAAHGVTPAAIAVAWIVRHPARIQVVLGSTNVQRLLDGAAGAEVVLSREEWYRLYRAAGHVLP